MASTLQQAERIEREDKARVVAQKEEIGRLCRQLDLETNRRQLLDERLQAKTEIIEAKEKRIVDLKQTVETAAADAAKHTTIKIVNEMAEISGFGATQLGTIVQTMGYEVNDPVFVHRLTPKAKGYICPMALLKKRKAAEHI